MIANKSLIYRVYRCVLQGQDGNQGEEKIWIASFPDKESARMYVNRDRRLCGVHKGWLRYEVVEKEAEG